MAFLWITFGGIFMGAAHDFIAGIVSLRSNGASLPETVGTYWRRILGKHSAASRTEVVAKAIWIRTNLEGGRSAGPANTLWLDDLQLIEGTSSVFGASAEVEIAAVPSKDLYETGADGSVAVDVAVPAAVVVELAAVVELPVPHAATAVPARPMPTRARTRRRSIVPRSKDSPWSKGSSSWRGSTLPS